MKIWKVVETAGVVIWLVGWGGGFVLSLGPMSHNIFFAGSLLMFGTAGLVVYLVGRLGGWLSAEPSSDSYEVRKLGTFTRLAAAVPGITFSLVGLSLIGTSLYVLLEARDYGFSWWLLTPFIIGVFFALWGARYLVGSIRGTTEVRAKRR
jgi:hypothetical protein